MIPRTEQRQYLATLILNLLPMTFGATCAWVSSAVLELTSQTDPLFPSGPITPSEVSWIGSVMSFGAIFGTLLFGYLVDKIGRKLCILLSALPMIISWILMVFAEDVMTLCIARLISGFGAGGIFLLTPLFIQEISDDRIRGSLCSSIVLFVNLGAVCMFVVANYCSYRVYSAVFMTLPILHFLLVLIYLPETPKRLLAVNKLAEAERSLQFYHNDKNYQIGTLMQKNPSEGSELDEKQTKDVKEEVEQTSLWQELKLKSVRKAFIIGTVMMWFNQFCGLFTMMTFAGFVFEESGSSLSPNVSSIVVAIIQLVGSYCSTIFVDRFGRKILLAGSGFGIALGLSGLGIYIFCQVELQMDVSGIAWMSLVCFGVSILVGYCGIMSLPFVIVAEIFPQRIAGVASTYCMILMHLLTFVVVKMFPVMSDAFGIQYSFFFFASCSFIGAMFTIFGMPETKGRSLDEIEMLMR